MTERRKRVHLLGHETMTGTVEASELVRGGIEVTTDDGRVVHVGHAAVFKVEDADDPTEWPVPREGWWWARLSGECEPRVVEVYTSAVGIRCIRWVGLGDDGEHALNAAKVCADHEFIRRVKPPALDDIPF